jgi:hypothetical protein
LEGFHPCVYLRLLSGIVRYSECCPSAIQVGLSESFEVRFPLPALLPLELYFLELVEGHHLLQMHHRMSHNGYPYIHDRFLKEAWQMQFFEGVFDVLRLDFFLQRLNYFLYYFVHKPST